MQTRGRGQARPEQSRSQSSATTRNPAQFPRKGAEVSRRVGIASSYRSKSLRRMVPARATKPVPNNPSVPGSGTFRWLLPRKIRPI